VTPGPEQPVVTTSRRDAPAPGCYLYALVPATGPIPARRTGVDGTHPIRTVRCGPVTAVVSDLDPETFGPEELERRLRDRGWVEEAVRTHDDVVRRAAETGPVLPLRFCTILRDEAGLAELLDRHRDGLVAALDRLADRQEWGCKLYRDHGTVADHVLRASPRVAEMAGEIDAAGEGRAWFLRKRLQDVVGEEVERLSAEHVAGCHDRLAALAGAGATLPLQRPEATGRAGEMVLNATYLVHGEDLDAFLAAADGLRAELAPRGFALQITGPWPPYSFVPDDIMPGAAP
jgi:hypothetical protein